MIPLNSRLASLLAVSIFILSLVLSLYFESYQLAVSGVLIVIVLTAFIPGSRVTLLTGVFSMIVMTAVVMYLQSNQPVVKALFSQVYSLLIIIFTIIIVFYLKILQQNLAHEKTHMISLFENATEGILLTNRSGEIVLANPAAERMFGYTAADIVGHKIEMLIPTRYHHHHHDLRDDFYKNPGNRSMGHGRDLFAKRKDNSEFPVEISLSHYLQKNEQFVIAFIVDITVRKENEQKLLQQKTELESISNDIRKLNTELEGKVEERTQILKEALQRLEQSQTELSESLDKEKQLSEIKSRFVSMASHEFRTPLSTILSSATLITKYPNTDEFEKRERHIKKIKDSVNHLNELLEDFLSLGKLEEGKITYTASEFDIKEFAEDVIDEMRVQLKEGQSIVFNTDEKDKLNLKTDKRIIKNILINLISNAIKFSNKNKTITVNAKLENEKLILSVSDEGLGIPAEDIPHLFDSFYRGKNVTNIQGTGLGLPIVKRYLDIINGSISVESELGKGTCFTVTISPLDEE